LELTLTFDHCVLRCSLFLQLYELGFPLLLSGIDALVELVFLADE
jgi:hypothetical protein